MANWESYRIADVISDIDDRRIVLPVIQRRLVWDEEKMELLFDTLLKGDSFGGIMVIKEDKNDKPLFSFRPFTKDGEPIQSVEVERLEQNQSFVIDGQQRLQSFYIGLRGTFNGKILYFDLFSNYNSEFNFKFEKDYQKLPKEVKDDGRLIKKYNWFPASELLKQLRLTGNEKNTAKKIIATQKIQDAIEEDHILENVASFHRHIISNKSIGICEVALDKTFDPTLNRQRIVELFRRLNDGGTRLSPFDLVASILKGFEWQMETFLEDILSQYHEIGLSQDNLIKLLFLLQDNHVKEMTEIDASDAQFAIENKERIKSMLAALNKFLHASDLHNFYKDGNRSFIPLFFVCYHIFHKTIPNSSVENFFNNYDANNSEFVRINKWIFLSLINGVFRSKGAGWTPYKTGIRKILAVIKNYKNSPFPISQLFDVYKEHGVTFTESIDETSLESFDYNFIYYLMYDKKITIRVQDVDHIMPKSILERLQFDWKDINSIKNYQLLDFGTNRGEKNARPFKNWLNECVADKAFFIKKHLIPPNENLWDESAFLEFSKERKALLLDKIRDQI